MSAHSHNENVEELIYKLCYQITKAEKDDLNLIFKTVIKDLKIGKPDSAQNEFTSIEFIKKKLISDDREEDCNKLTKLCTLIRKENVNDLGPVLFLFNQLYGTDYENIKLSAGKVKSIRSSTPLNRAPDITPTPIVDCTMGSNMSSGFHSNISHTPSMSTTFRSTDRSGVSGLSTISTIDSSRRYDTSRTNESIMNRSTPVLTGRNRQPPKYAYVNENILLRELLFVLQGIDGKHIRYDSTRDRYSLDTKLDLDISMRQSVLKIAENGWLYKKIIGYVKTSLANRTSGPIGESFCMALNQEISEYFRLLSILESQIIVQTQEATVGLLMDDCRKLLTVARLNLHLYEPRKRLTIMAALVDISKGKIGGNLASCIHSYTSHGDPSVQSLVIRLLHFTCAPIFSTIVSWIYSGVLDDVYQEFFVASNPSVKKEKLWNDKYSLRKSMIPSFLTMAQASRILITGKTINFLHQVCDDRTNIRDLDIVKAAETHDVASMFSDSLQGDFQRMIDVVYKETSTLLLEVMKKKYLFLEHLRAIRNFLLLGKGDFICHLMDLLEDDLKKPASTLYLHKLTSTLDQAIRNTNATYEHAEVLKRLDVRILEISPGDTGWDVFSMDYHFDGPIRTIFTPECIFTYLRIFNFLWRVKRMEYVLTHIWHNQNIYNRILKSLSESHPLLHQCHLLLREMFNFVQQLQYYINFEVLEYAWNELESNVNEAKDLDSVISAHENFLDMVVSKTLLDAKSGEILTQLRTVFDLIVQFQLLQKSFFDLCDDEILQRLKYKEQCVLRTKQGSWATNKELEFTENERIEKFQNTLKSVVKCKLFVLSQSYQNMIFQFLTMLHNHTDPSLRYLSYRLNFNEYYKQ